jgi:sulfide:quinone oxidoreductase
MELHHRHEHWPPRVVIAGGGVAALECALGLTTLAPGAAEVVLVCPADSYHDRPLALGEPFGLGRPHRYPMSLLCSSIGVRLIVDAVHTVMPEAHTLTLGSGELLTYDLLVVATGAHRFPAFEHGVTFDRDTSAEDFDEVLFDLEGGMAPRIAIIVPDGVTWSLPAYELALLTAQWAQQHRHPETLITVYTHESEPLILFGPTVSRAVADMLDGAHVSLRTGVHPDVVTPTALRAGGAWAGVDRIVSLPRVTGPHLPRVPSDRFGFIPTDDAGRVAGHDDIYAAGDGTSSPIKQGGLAAQQADAVATHIAARLGADVAPRPWRPVLRGLLSTADGPRFLRAELDDPEGTSTISAEPLWWPPSKISSRWLAPHLARLDRDGSARGTAVTIG